jgi:hypothetical protein
MGKPELLDVIPRDYPVPKPWVLRYIIPYLSNFLLCVDNHDYRPISENQFQRDDHNDTDSSHVPLKVYNQAYVCCL